jgi:hypothetical protein
MPWQGSNGVGITFVLSLRATKGSAAIRRSRCEGEARACTPKWRYGTQAWQSQEFPRFARDKTRRFTPRNDIPPFHLLKECRCL